MLQYVAVRFIRSLGGTLDVCEICGATHNLDRHHIVPKRMGGTSNPAVHDEANLMTLCRSCHRKLHEGHWDLVALDGGVRVVDRHTGEQVMRRYGKADFDAPATFGLLNLAEHSLEQLLEGLPYLTDEQLIQAFGYASAFGKRSWLAQAAILYEAQQRSVYGARSLEAIASSFQIGLRQAQKYALVWKTFFVKEGVQENVNIDAIVLDEPSWYVLAVTETKDPEQWLAYAQDRKMENLQYSVAAFRRDIQLARVAEAVAERQAAQVTEDESCPLPRLETWRCPWVKVLCVRLGKPIPYQECRSCERMRAVDGQNMEEEAEEKRR